MFVSLSLLFSSQAIEFAIAEKESRNGPSTQGEDKLAEALCNVYFDESSRHQCEVFINLLPSKIKAVEDLKVELTHKHEVFLKEAKLALAQALEMEASGSYGGERTLDWMSLYHVFLSKSAFSESIYDSEGINKVLGDVAKIDRLPSTNTLEAAILLRHAWDCVDIYQAMADRYKRIANSKSTQS